MRLGLRRQATYFASTIRCRASSASRCTTRCSQHQRAADLAAVSAGELMRELYPRLFEPPLLENGLPNPRHLPLPDYLAFMRRVAVRGARRNGWT